MKVDFRRLGLSQRKSEFFNRIDWKQTHSFQVIRRPPPIAASEKNVSGHLPQTPENGKLPFVMRRCYSGDEMSSAHALP